VSVELEKRVGGFGFTLEGGKGSMHGDRPLIINRIFKGLLIILILIDLIVFKHFPIKLTATFFSSTTFVHSLIHFFNGLFKKHKTDFLQKCSHVVKFGNQLL